MRIQRRVSSPLRELSGAAFQHTLSSMSVTPTISCFPMPPPSVPPGVPIHQLHLVRLPSSTFNVSDVLADRSRLSRKLNVIWSMLICISRAQPNKRVLSFFRSGLIVLCHCSARLCRHIGECSRSDRAQGTDPFPERVTLTSRSRHGRVRHVSAVSSLSVWFSA